MAQKSWSAFLRLSLVSCPVNLSLATPETEATDQAHEAFEAMASKIIELEHFVPRAEVDPLHLDASYYVRTDNELAAVSLRVIAEKMIDKGLAGIGHVTLANRKRLVMFEPRGAGMVMYTLHNEVHDAGFDTKRQDNFDPEMLEIIDAVVDRRTTKFDLAGLLAKA
jgi:DNA end-binding protein Ku